MKLKLLDPRQVDKTFKVAIQKTGKLGFTKECAEYLKLSESKTANLSIDEEDIIGDTLYLAIYQNEHGLLKIQKAGSYFYINCKVLFDSLKIPYLDGGVSFTLKKVKLEDEIYYELARIREGIKEETKAED